MTNYPKCLSMLIICLLGFSCSTYDEVGIARADRGFGYVPVEFVTESGLRDYQFLPPQPIVNPGKVFSQGRYLLIGENKKGIHVFDNIVSQNPSPIAFISVPGSIDFVYRNRTLITTNGNDLLALNVGAINSVAENGSTIESVASNRAFFSEIRRLDEVFTYPNFPQQRGNYFMCLDSAVYVTEWKLDSVDSKKDCFR